MSNKIARAFASITSAFSRGPSKPPAASGKAGALRPATNSALQDLSARKGAMAAGAPSLTKGDARKRISAHDLSHAIAAAQARSQARTAARIKALPTPALPLDVQMRFNALKAGAPKLGSGGSALKREPTQGLPKDLQSRFDALKAGTPKPGATGGTLKREPADESPEGLQMRFDALKASMPQPSSGRASLEREPEAEKVEKADSGASQPTSHDMGTSVSAHADAGSATQPEKASGDESAKPLESSVSNEAPASHSVESGKTEGGEPEDAKADGAKADGAKADDAKADGPKAESAKVEEVKTEPQEPHEELAGLAGKVNDHVNNMHQAAAAHPSEQEQLMMQEMAELHQVAMLISQMLARLIQRSGEALLAITRSA